LLSFYIYIYILFLNYFFKKKKLILNINNYNNIYNKLKEYLYFPLLIGIIFFFIKKRFTNSKERALLTLDINNVKKELAK